jgi:hypothetical protein
VAGFEFRSGPFWGALVFITILTPFREYRRLLENGGARFVPIYSLLKKSFRSNEVRPIAAAYELARAEFGLVDRLDPITEMVARRIIEIAKTGERDPKLISERAVQELMGTSHPETK